MARPSPCRTGKNRRNSGPIGRDRCVGSP
ncbi:hypothetical protein E0H70_28075 [Rhizobium leguminosarum bv. viciae]|nr:hypothetical protein ELH32_32945 [Rhizobium ruizarguesonis]TCA23636.1 hypothetical protein E0H70_28075 [Rhizobium leguminosarum bv. viciae]